MKKTTVLQNIIGIPSVLAIVFGFYLALGEVKRDMTLFFVYLAICIAGVIGLTIVALWITFEKRKEKAKEKQTVEEDDDDRYKDDPNRY